PRLKEAPGPAVPLAGRVGLEVAALLLLEPTKPASVRETARRLKRSPSSVSQALASMRDAALIDQTGRPSIPDLFWELALHWQPMYRDVQRFPSPAVPGVMGSINDALRL